MIIRLPVGIEPPHLLKTVDVPDAVGGRFGRVELLRFTSAELRELTGVSLLPTDLHTTFELAPALARTTERTTDALIRNNRLARVIASRPFLLPAFVGYQETGGAGLLPFMTDGVPGKWSLFFEPDGRMTLIRWEGDRFQVCGDRELGETDAGERRLWRGWDIGRVIGRARSKA